MTSSAPGPPGGDQSAQLPDEFGRAIQKREHGSADSQRRAHIGSWAWDIASGEVTWSDELYRIFGLRPHVFTPSYEGFFALVGPGHRPRIESVVQKALAGGESCAYECPITLPDGRERWIRALCMVDLDGAGGALRMHGTVQDVTDYDNAAPAATTSDAYRGLHDPLTGLATWELFADRAQAALARADRNHWTTAQLVIDLDQFHEVNDHLGHEAGNVVLMEVARRLEEGFRPYDTIARATRTVTRVGGDEFAVLCEDVPDAAAARALSRRVALLFESPIKTAGGTVAVSAAVGVALAPAGNLDVEQFFADAESAMRAAKGRGRGGEFLLGEDGFGTNQVVARDALARALAEGELRLFYQPKIDLVTDRIAGVEALLRWQHPDRGMVPPLDFIPLAEESGLIIPIGAWVIEEACHEAARWVRTFPGRPALVVSVNVSVRQFGRDLVGVVKRALSESGTQASSLCLEVTESLLVEDVEASIILLRDLAALGVAVSIDDFGTGYSSLSSLKRFPLDELKVDKSFVDGLGTDADDTAIVAAVIAMAHALGLHVVAEGVETAEQLHRLRTLGCEQVQGYYFAPPGPPDAIDGLLHAEASDRWKTHGQQPQGQLPEAAAYRPDRVLVVDDVVDVRELARMSLTAVGFEVHEAVDGASALLAARRIDPDCIVLDLSMPDMSGVDVCRALRADHVTANCTIVLLTGSADAADKVEAFSSGADDYIIKPFSPRDLASRVQAAVRRRRHLEES